MGSYQECKILYIKMFILLKKLSIKYCNYYGINFNSNCCVIGLNAI